MSAISAAISAVVAPMPATTSCASGARTNSGVARASRYTPAVTIVAAWIRALTGVGPSIASGNQTISGNWALLPIAPRNNKQANRRDRRRGNRGQLRRRPQHRGKVERAERPPDHEDRQHEAEVADPVDDERLLGRRGRARPAEPEADQEVAAQAHRLPEHEQQQEIVRQHQHAHREHEQRNLGEEPREAGVALHVPRGEHRHQEAHERDHREHHRGHRVGLDVDANVEPADLEELVAGCHGRRARVLREAVRHDRQQQHERANDGDRQRDPAGPMAPRAEQLGAQQPGDDCRGQRGGGDQPHHELLAG